jgi:uncharacterized protein (TIGR03067 family)
LPANWDVAVTAKPALAIEAEGHTAAVKKVLLRDKGRQAITVSLDKTVRIWDVETGDLLHTLWMPDGPGERGQLEAAALSPDETLLVVAGRSPGDGPAPLYLIDPAAGQLVRTIQEQQPIIRVLAFSPDGKRLAAGGDDRTVRVYAVQSGQCDQSFVHNTEIYSIAFSPDGSQLLVGARDEVRIWPASGGAHLAWWSPGLKVYNPDDPRDVNELRDRLALPQPITAVAWHPDAKTVMVGSADGIVREYDTAGKKLRRFHLSQSPIRAATQAVTALRYLEDGKSLFYTGCNVAGKPSSGILDVAAGNRRAEVQHEGPVLAGATSEDGKLAISTGGPTNETVVWQVNDGTEVARLEGRGKTIGQFFAWAPDGQAIGWRQARGPLTSLYPLDSAFRIDQMQFDTPTEETISWSTQRFPQPGKYLLRPAGHRIERVPQGAGQQADAVISCGRDDEALQRAVYLANGRAALAGRFGVYIIDVEKMAVVHKLVAHTAPVLLLAPSPDGRRLASTSLDQTVRIWDPEQDEPLLSLFVAGTDWVAWTPQGYYAASPGGERLMGWKISNGPAALATYYPAAQFRKSLYRPAVLRGLFKTGSITEALAQAGRDNRATADSVEKARPPLAAITFPPGPVGYRVAGTNLTVRGAARSVNDQPVTAIRLLIDGRPYGGAQGVRKVDPPHPGDVEVSWQVELAPGKHLFTVQAESAVSQGLSPVVEVTNTAGSATLPNLYVVAAGVNAYPGALKLRYAAPDAEAITQALSGQTQSKLFRKVEVKLLRDQQASRRGIEEGLAWLKSKMTPEEVGVFFFSGHGARDDSDNFYLIPVDVNPKDLAKSCISGAYLKQVLGEVPGRVVAVLDACHSGAAINARNRAGSDDLIRDLVSDEYGIVVLSSSLGQEYSLEAPSVAHGFYTQSLIEGLSGLADRNRNGTVDLNELDRYTTRRVVELSHGRQHPVISRPLSIRSFGLAASTQLPAPVAPPEVPVVALAPLADKSELQGQWQVQQYEVNGTPREAREYYWAIHRDSIRHDVAIGGGAVWKFKIDPSKSPKQIDIHTTPALNGKGEALPGIYLLEGDTLKVCFRITEGERPTEFTAAAGSKQAQLVLKRVNDNPDAPKPRRNEPTIGAKLVATVPTENVGWIHFLRFAPDGSTLLTGSTIGIAEWDTGTQKTTRWISKFNGTRFVGFSADCKTVVYGTGQDLTAVVVDVATGKNLATLKAPQLQSAAISPDGKQVALGSKVLRLVDLASGRERELAKGKDEFDGAVSVAFSNDGKLVAACFNSRLALFDVQTGKEVRSWEPKQAGVSSMSFSPDDKTLAIGSGRDRRLKLWEVSTGNELHDFQGHKDAVSTVAFSPDGSLLVSGTNELGPGKAEIKVWNVITGKEVASMFHNNAGATAVTFSPDSRRVFVGAGTAVLILELTPPDGQKP